MMKIDMVNPFVLAAREVLHAELDCDIERGKIQLLKSAVTHDDVTAMVAVTGQVRGLVLYTMSDETARAMAGRMIGQECDTLDELAQSAIAELANMITGRAGVFLEEADVHAEISPPALILGNGNGISTVDLQRLVVPLSTVAGDIAIQLALESAA